MVWLSKYNLKICFVLGKNNTNAKSLSRNQMISPEGRTEEEKEEDKIPNFALLPATPRHSARITEISGEMGWLGRTLPEWKMLKYG